MTRDLSDANKEKRRLVKVARQYAQDVKAKGNYASQLVQKVGLSQALVIDNFMRHE